MDTGLLKHQFRCVPRPLQQVGRHSLEIFTSELQRQRFSMEVNRKRYLSLFTEGTLGVFAFHREVAHRFRVGTRVIVKLAEELFGDVVGNSLRPVDPPQHDVTVCCQHFELGWRVPHNGHVERSTPKVVNENRF